MKGRRSLQELVRQSGVNPVLEREPGLPPPIQPAVLASEEDHAEARRILVERRINDPDYRDPNKQLKRLFKSSKEKAKSQDVNSWTFSQEELDNALSDLIEKPATGPGLVQAFLNFGAKVNFVEASSKKKGGKQPAVVDRRRSTVLQRAATVKKFDSVSLLASHGADQVTLDEGLKAALASNDASCVQELLRHGADLNKCPTALADAVRANDVNFIRLLLRAPKALKLEVVSSCLPAAVQQKSEPIISLLVGNGADPNFDGASALTMAISQREYRLAVALVAGPIPLTPGSLQRALVPAMNMPTAQELYQMLQLLFCSGLPPSAPGLEGLLIAAAKNDDTAMAELLVRSGVSTSANDAECLRIAIARSNWTLTDAILETPISPAQATTALAIVPARISKPERLHIISALVRKGGNGKPVQDWLVRAVEESDSQLMNLLLNAGVPVSGSTSAIQAAVARKDFQSLQTLLGSGSASPQALATVFPLIRSGYTASERLKVCRLLLAHGARGPEVDQSLVDAVADTSASRDVALITELVRAGADVNHENGKVIQCAVRQADVAILRLLCDAKPTLAATSASLPLVFDSNGFRQSSTLPMVELLISHGVEEGPAIATLNVAVKGGSSNLDIIQRLIATDARLRGPAFQQVIALNSLQDKATLLKFLLTTGIPQQSLDQALVTEVRHVNGNYDTTVVQILLNHGASVNYNGAEALIVGVSSGNLDLARRLLGAKHVPSRITITKAFERLFRGSSMSGGRTSSGDRVQIAQELLARGVDQPAIDSALLSVLDPANSHQEIGPVLDILLQRQGDVNVGDGKCFAFAAQRNDPILFEKLLEYQPCFESLLPMLVTSDLDESIVRRCLEACFNHGCGSEALDASRKPILYFALQKYPRSGDLAQLLLSHGCNPDFFVAGEIDAATGEEMLPALVWALAQPQKMVSSAIIQALLSAGASPSRSSSISEITPIALAAREGRADVVQALLDCGADPSVRDNRNRSALFYASSTSVTPVVQALTPHALPNDGSLHEAARCLQLDIASILVKQGHSPNYPSSLHEGRSALGELCLYAEVVQTNQRTKLRRLIRLFLEHGANPKFKARNERSVVILALDNPYNALAVTEALLETEVWEHLNDEKHLYRDPNGLWYSPLKYIELVPGPNRATQAKALATLLLDKGCEPKYYSESADQPPGATGLPAPVARLADRQKEHALTLRLAQESADHARALEETHHRARLRRAAEQQAADQQAASAAAAHTQALAQQTHEAEMARVRAAERMKRGEKAAWHALMQEQERDAAAQRARLEDSRRSASLAHEAKMSEGRRAELEHRAGVERRALKEKEELYERNVKRQMLITQRMDESAKVHASLRQERPAIEGAHWGSVD